MQPRTLVSLLSFVFLMVVAPQAQQPAQQATPTFKSSTKLVVQTVTVKDKDGKPIEGLTAKDFTVTEDGELQTISFVEYQRLDPTRERSDFGPRRGDAADGVDRGARRAVAAVDHGGQHRDA